MEQDCQPPSPAWLGPSNLVDQGKPSLKRDRLRCNADMRPLALPPGSRNEGRGPRGWYDTGLRRGEICVATFPRGDRNPRVALTKSPTPSLCSLGRRRRALGPGLTSQSQFQTKQKRLFVGSMEAKPGFAGCRFRLSADRRHRRSVARTSSPALRGPTARRRQNEAGATLVVAPAAGCPNGQASI
jgi:hypothetical protein